MRKRSSKILVTGGAGFIGSEFVRQGVRKGQKIAVIDKLTYAGDLTRLKEVNGRYAFHKTDTAQKPQLESVFKKERPDVVVNFAAETHVDRSIQDNHPFINANVRGVQNLIECARTYKVRKFVHVSTDEVYGSHLKGRFSETAPLRPRNPYAATKAAADLLVQAAVNTYGLPAMIVRPANNYGPWQYPEKLVPVIILKALKNNKVPVYGKGAQIREWLHVADCAAAIHLVLRKGKVNKIYNVSSYYERNNLTTVKAILRAMDKGNDLIEFVRDRPGHDFRYSVCCAKLRKLGWRPKIHFAQGIRETVKWNRDHLPWLERKLRFLESYWKKVYVKK